MLPVVTSTHGQRGMPRTFGPFSTRRSATCAWAVAPPPQAIWAGNASAHVQAVARPVNTAMTATNVSPPRGRTTYATAAPITVTATPMPRTTAAGTTTDPPGSGRTHPT